MKSNTSVSLGSHFDSFVGDRIAAGRFRNASEVIRAGLRLLEEEEIKFANLRSAIQEGLDSGVAKGFDPKKNLKQLKAERRKNG